MQKVEFSFIIPTKNEEDYIDNCLGSIKNQSGKKEVIVVDSYSKDKTVKIARKYKAKVIYEKRKGPGVARNTGAKRAKGRILIFADADVVLPKNFLLKLKKEFKRHIVGGVFMQKSNVSSIILWNMLVKYAIGSRFILTNGCCFVFDRKVFNRVGGFDPELLTNEDHDLARRVSKFGRFVFFDDIVILISTRRLKRLGFFEFFKRNVKATLMYFLKHRSSPEYWK